MNLRISKRELGREGDLVTLEAHLVPSTRATIEGVGDYEAVRRTLNRRIDQAIRTFKFAVRRSGSQGSFEAYVDLQHLPLQRSSAIAGRDTLEAAIVAVESG
jgi:hypothetical protein